MLEPDKPGCWRGTNLPMATAIEHASSHIPSGNAGNRFHMSNV
jgi:hypothetical protein